MSNFNLFILLIVFGVLVLAGIGAGTFLLWHHLRTRGLREQFGPEYDRTLEQAGSRKAGEAQLLERRRRHRTLELRTLDSAELSQFQQRWTDMQREFVDDPARAVQDADTLVVDVMSARGYPTNDLDQRAEDLSVDHPHIAQHYRDARRIAKADQKGNASTEDQRQAVTAYRALLEELLTDKKGEVDLGGRRNRNRRGDSVRANGRNRERADSRDSDHLHDRAEGRDDRRVDDRRDHQQRDSDRLDDRRVDDRRDDRVDRRVDDRVDDRRDRGVDYDTRGGVRENPTTERETRA